MLNAAQAAERRTANRVPYADRAMVYTRQSQIPCVTHDISTSGMLVFPAVAGKPAPQEMRIDLAIGPGRTAISVTGIVVRETRVDGKYAWGVHFLRVDGENRTALDKLIRVELHRQSGLHAAVPNTGKQSSPDAGKPGTGSYSMVANRGQQLERTTVPNAGTFSKPGNAQPRPPGASSSPGTGSHPRIAVNSSPGTGSNSKVGTDSRPGAGSDPNDAEFPADGWASKTTPIHELFVRAVRDVARESKKKS